MRGVGNLQHVNVSPLRWRAQRGRRSNLAAGRLREATGDTKLPTLKLADGTVLKHSKAIMGWIAEQK